ncbi:probable myosin-binding protein 5 [Momordica charantia]|uniref:Probable myosin-binding protein 5 n=1 Tax=Momordica charantia TaxID=3673 RepID=A0A6J1C6J4_MOMCH|nr:probable myosin-binding protein 5 [Momordica charantia]
MAKRSFTRFVEQELGTFPHFLVCAVLEWVLIILLFVDGFVGFLANEFAKFFELRVPCLFCTRIDHVLVRKNADFYYNHSICEGHKKDVSSLAYCHNHKKLSDIRQMCEVCLLSFATEKESDCNTYKSLVGILHKDLECFVEDDRQVVSLPTGKKDEGVHVEKGGDYCCCSCCGEPLKLTSANSKAKNGTTFSQAPAPSPRAAFKNDDKTSLELPHIRYTELKLLSDEPEFVEDDEGLHGRNLDSQLSGIDSGAVKEDVKAVKAPLLPEGEDGHETSRTPVFGRGNKFFGIPLTDSANNSPRWAFRVSRKSPLERTEFQAENFEADMLGPGDNDSILNCLKRQVKIDRKSLMELYMELDEERSASAVAANNAMAMITRLQAEKAAVQMEALQYQRMMEEQAEYDQEALQATNDLLAKREEEIKVLEAEIDAYREKYGYLGDGSPKLSEDEISDEDYQEFKSQSCLSSDEKSDCGTPFSLNGRENNKEIFNILDVPFTPSAITPSAITPSASKIDRENSKEESINDHGVALTPPASKIDRENSKEESINDHGVALTPSVSKIARENSKEESINDHGVALTPSVSKIARENSKEESINDHGVALPSSQGKAGGEGLNEIRTSFKGEKTFLLGRLKKAKKISDDGLSALQSTTFIVDQVDEDTGNERTSSLTQQLSNLNAEGEHESSKHEGKRMLTKISHDLRKLQIHVDEDSDEKSSS